MGVPVIAPVEAFSLSPAGNVPLVVVQFKGGVPPVATRVALYTTPTWPLGKELVEMARGVGVVLPEDELQPCKIRRLIKRSKEKAKKCRMKGPFNFSISVEFAPELGPEKLSVKTWRNTLTEVLEPPQVDGDHSLRK